MTEKWHRTYDYIEWRDLRLIAYYITYLYVQVYQAAHHVQAGQLHLSDPSHLSLLEDQDILSLSHQGYLADQAALADLPHQQYRLIH